jgi:hypothetical protein
MLVHTIRLREPWTRITVNGGEHWTRRFAAPTGINDGERVFLAARDLPCAAQVLLNDQELGRLACGKSGRWDITDSIMPRNEVCLAIEQSPQDEGGSGRELLVRLEIETGA